MKAIVQNRYGSPDVLELREVDEPVAADDQMLVRVRAASVHADVWHVMRGVPYVLRIMGAGLRAPKDLVPGTDLAGTVESVGRNVSRFRPGDEVFGQSLVANLWRHGGAFAEYAAVPEARFEPKPVGLTFEQAAAVPTSGSLAAPLQARPDEPIRIWVLNAGPTLTTAFHVIGALFDHVFADGNPTSGLSGLQAYNIAPGVGAMFELRIPDAGLYPFVTHSFAYTGRGAVGVIQVTPDAPSAPETYPTTGDPFTGGLLEFGSTPATVDAHGADGSAGDHGGPIAIDAAITGFDPAEIEASDGDIALAITNLDAFEHDFTIDKLDVKLLLGANETVDTTFTATPGTYTFYCSIPGHREAGMEGTLTVLPGAGH
jgi:plastocyanin